MSTRAGRRNPTPATPRWHSSTNSDIDTTVVTQNTDGLHQRAGTPADRVIELHGDDARRHLCRVRASVRDGGRVGPNRGRRGHPAVPAVRGIMKTASTMFGQTMSPEVFARAEQAVTTCDLCWPSGRRSPSNRPGPMRESRSRRGDTGHRQLGSHPLRRHRHRDHPGWAQRGSSPHRPAVARRCPAGARRFRRGGRLPTRPETQSAVAGASADRAIPLAGRRAGAAHGVVCGHGSADPPRVGAGLASPAWRSNWPIGSPRRGCGTSSSWHPTPTFRRAGGRCSPSWTTPKPVRSKWL